MESKDSEGEERAGESPGRGERRPPPIDDAALREAAGIATLADTGLQIQYAGARAGSAARELSPWDVYRPGHAVVSANRMLLSQAMTDFCEVQWEYDGNEIADAFQMDASVEPDEMVSLTSSVDFLAGLILDETLKCWCRPFGGGDPARVPPALWEMDDFLPRFASSAFDPAKWHVAGAPPTHWLFVDTGDFERFMNRWIATDRDDREIIEEVQTALPPPEPSNASEFIRLAEVMRITSLSRSTIYQKISVGSFPEPHRLGSRLSMWRRNGIAAWLRDPR